ncbi:MAG: ABC transporter ATP-binding protein [Phycisphaerales bacterium]
MLRSRGLAAAALLMAFVSAGGLGVGILGLAPVLRIIFGEHKDLPTLAAQWNARHAEAGAWYTPMVPQGLIDVLPTGEFNAVLVIVLGLGVLTLIGATANFLHEYLSITISTRAAADLRRRAFHRVLHMPLGEVVRGASSDLISRIISDSGVVQRGFEQLTSKAVAHVTKGAAALVTAFVLNWRLTLVSVVVAPLLGVILRKLGKRITRASRRQMQSQARLLEAAGEATRGFRVVKVHRAERYEIARFTRANEDVLRESMKVRTARAVAGPLMEVIAIFVAGVLALIAAKQIITGHLDATSFIMVLGALAVCGGSLKPLTGVLQHLQTARAASDRLAQLLEGPLEEVRETRRPKLARHAESIVFEDITFTYPGADAPALDGVSLTIPHGERVAVVGPNGCGKTTLLSLVPRLYEPGSGRVLVDGNDISKVTLASLREQIGVVTQETVLFRGTIASNIAYGLPPEKATRGAIEQAARRAHAHEFIEKLPQGYDMAVGEAGLTLSGGQRQRLAIARAILRDPAILIMDEATSMVDTESESQIAAAVAEFGRARTCLIVAHRLSTVINADRIVVMEKGRVLDQGTHTELLGRCGVYRGLAGALEHSGA